MPGLSSVIAKSLVMYRKGLLGFSPPETIGVFGKGPSWERSFVGKLVRLIRNVTLSFQVVIEPITFVFHYLHYLHWQLSIVFRFLSTWSELLVNVLRFLLTDHPYGKLAVSPPW